VVEAAATAEAVAAAMATAIVGRDATRPDRS